MTTKVVASLVAGVCLLSGMGGCMANNVAEETTIPFQVLSEGIHSSIPEQKFQIVRDTGTLNQTWRQAFKTALPVPATPNVDFRDHLVLALFLGQKRTGGYRLKVESVHEYPDSLVVRISIHNPGHGCKTIQMITSPYEIIQVPATGKEILFETTSTQGAC